MEMFNLKWMSGNQLKIIALICMTIDHVGLTFYPGNIILRIIGRIAFPIFAFMIAEGCRYTKNKLKYFLLMAGTALLCQLSYYFTTGSIFQSVLVSFTLSLSLIFLLEGAMKKNDAFAWVLAMSFLAVICITCIYLPSYVGRGYGIDYGLWGIMLPVFVYFGKTRFSKLFLCAVGLLMLCLDIGGIQWYSFIALAFLLLYNGKRGAKSLKYLFYVYYPLHLAVIYFIDKYI